MRRTVHLTDPLADAHNDTARMVIELASIVRAQNHSITETGTGPVLPEHAAMNDTQLDAALTATERAFIDRMNTSRIDPSRHGEYADNMRSALTRLADALTRSDAVKQPNARHLAGCDTERATSAVAVLTLYPEAAGLLDALDDAEGAHAAAIFPAVTTDTGDYLKAVNTAAAAADHVDTRYAIARLNPIAYAAFLTVLPHYLHQRSAIGVKAAPPAHAADLMNALATRLDRARADMAAAFARDRARTTTGTV
jgi:hypothetical protein